MRFSLAVTFLTVFIASSHLLPASSPSLTTVKNTAEESDTRAAGRKTVTAYADNETEAVAKAEKANPGWKAISAKKTSKDPKSRTWQVTLSKD